MAAAAYGNDAAAAAASAAGTGTTGSRAAETDPASVLDAAFLTAFLAKMRACEDVEGQYALLPKHMKMFPDSGYSMSFHVLYCARAHNHRWLTPLFCAGLAAGSTTVASNSSILTKTSVGNLPHASK
jgi:hypothetical protein